MRIVDLSDRLSRTESIIDVDIDNEDSLIVLAQGTQGAEVVLPHRGDRVELSVGSKPMAIRWMASNRAVVATERSACIVDLENGDIKTRIGTSFGASEILVNHDFIVVAYSDEAIYRGRGPAAEGVVVFDAHGAYLFGYASEFGSEAVSVSDCYCACWGGDSRIAFHPYDGFEIVLVDLPSRSQTVLEIPEALHGSDALSVRSNDFWFHGGRRGTLRRWHAGGQDPVVVGHIGGELRGLPSGRFLRRHHWALVSDESLSSLAS